jgi:hypothetical protein
MQRITLEIAAKRLLYIAKNNYGISPETIISKSRKGMTPRIRQAIAVILREEFPEVSLREIGLELGGKDHSTVHSCLRTHSADMNFDESYSVIFTTLYAEFNAYATNELQTLLEHQDRLIQQIMPLQRELAEVTAKIVNLKTKI